MTSQVSPTQTREDSLPAQSVALGDLLQTLAREMSDLAHRAEHLQHVVSPLLTPSADGLHELQELDLIAQQLAALSRFISHLTPSPDWRVDTREAGDALTLADLARRLTRPLEAHVPADTAGGELFLFE